MFRLPVIEPNMIQNIKEHTNKSLEKYKTNKNKIFTNNCCPDSNNGYVSMYYYVPFLSLFSFLAGYHFCHIIKTINKNK